MAITLFPLSGGFRGIGRLGLRLAAQPIAVALEVVDLAVVEQAIDEGRGEGGVVQDATPGLPQGPLPEGRAGSRADRD